MILILTLMCKIGGFIGVQAPEEAQRNGEVFGVAKVREVKNAT